MARSDDAVKEFKGGLNCAQSILVTFGPALGLEREMAVRTASGLAAGVGRTGRICGAASGACLVLGLAYCEGESGEAREKSLGKVEKFLSEFECRFGAVDCLPLIGCSLRTAEERAKARKQGLFDTRCAMYVRAAAEILDEMLAE